MSSAGARVLVVDGDGALRHSICGHLRAEGMQVLEAESGLAALSALRRGAVDIALIDVLLPEIDGLELVRRVRLESTLPIILLTARGDEATCVAGLSAGADDLIVKPVPLGEVSARINAQLRRAHGFGTDRTMLRSGAVELDLAARRCRIHGDEVALTRREFDLLSALLRYAGRIHTREQLLELVWGGEEVSSQTVDATVAAVRRKLGPAISIVTLRGVGYRLDPVEAARDAEGVVGTGGVVIPARDAEGVVGTGGVVIPARDAEGVVGTGGGIQSARDSAGVVVNPARDAEDVVGAAPDVDPPRFTR